MGHLRDQMMHDLELADFVPKTRLCYLNSIRDFAKFFRRSPSELGADEVRVWIGHLSKHVGVGPARIRQHMAELKFLYPKTLWKPEAVSFLSWPQDPQKLPVVLSADEVQRLLAASQRPKYRVFFTTVYATGLRLNEACLLETRDIDAARGVIHVRNAKGRRERYVMLSGRLLSILRAYWALERPPAPWLFASACALGTQTRAPDNPSFRLARMTIATCAPADSGWKLQYAHASGEGPLLRRVLVGCISTQRCALGPRGVPSIHRTRTNVFSRAERAANRATDRRSRTAPVASSFGERREQSAESRVDLRHRTAHARSTRRSVQISRPPRAVHTARQIPRTTKRSDGHCMNTLVPRVRICDHDASFSHLENEQVVERIVGVQHVAGILEPHA